MSDRIVIVETPPSQISVKEDPPAQVGVNTGEATTTPDATATTKGVIRLSGDLTGTADEPRLVDPPVGLVILFENALV